MAAFNFVNSLLILGGLAYTCLLCYGAKEICEEERYVYYFPRTYTSPTYTGGNYLEFGGQCTVRFYTTHPGTIIKLEIIDMNLPTWTHNRCDHDKIVIYDGKTTQDPQLHEICGSDTQEVTSSGQDLLLVYTFDTVTSPNSNGFQLRYMAIDISGTDYDEDLDFGLSAGAIVGICVVPIICLVFIMVVVVKYCNVCQQMRQDLASKGYTTHDLRLTQMTMLYQARHGQLATTTMWGGQQVTRNARIVDVKKALRDWASRGMVADPGDPLQVIVQQHMDQFSAQRQGRQPHHTSRTRHPAGDIRSNPNPSVEQYPLYPQHHSASNVPSLFVDMAGDGYHPPNAHHTMDVSDDGGSNNNVLINNNTAANLNYQNGQNGARYSPFPSNPSPANTNSLGRRSPQLDQLHPQEEGSRSNTLTFYGMIDSGSPASAPPATPIASHGLAYEAPPPSYEEVTAGGRLSPYHKQ